MFIYMTFYRKKAANFHTIDITDYSIDCGKLEILNDILGHFKQKKDNPLNLIF